MEHEMTTPAGDAPATGQPAAPATGDDGSQQTGQPTSQQQTNQPGESQEGDQGDDTGTVARTPAEEAAYWKAMSRKHESRAASNADAAKKLRAFEDASKTELQLAQERATAAEAAAADATSERHRLLASAKHGLTPELAGFLGNGTEAEIFQRAEQLDGQIDAAVTARLTAELGKYGIQYGQTQQGAAPSAGAAASLANGRRPVSQLRSGATPAPQASGANGDTNAAFRSMFGRGLYSGR
jgi:hypothetical protein